MVRALERPGFPPTVLRHGVQRDAYLFPLVSNLEGYVRGRTTEPACFNRRFVALAEHRRTRWLPDRAERVDGWRHWQPEKLVSTLILSEVNRNTGIVGNNGEHDTN